MPFKTKGIMRIIMNICLYGASSSTIDQSYVTATEEFGRSIAKRGHNLVYGGGALGLMGAAARGTLAEGGKVIGIAPTFFKAEGVLFKQCSEFIYTNTMRERKQLMDDKSQAFVMVPGAIGTFDEFFEILTLKQLGRHNKAIAIYNINGYYDQLIAMINTAIEQGFMSDGCSDLCKSFDNAQDLLVYLENYKTTDCDVKNLKEHLK